MKIQVGCNFETFKQYYEALWGTLGETEADYIQQNPAHLIIIKENEHIIGDMIWHESNTQEHKPGNPRSKEDSAILLRLLGDHQEFIELHEVWLRKEYRGKGYGKKMFAFFEQFIRQQGFKTAIYYAYNPAAIAICRHRKYREAGCIEIEGIEGNREAMHVFHIALLKNK
ncbi:MAG: GNAT family N-acetyltransferase [Candidatus Thorarchaeota archaeon]